MKMPIEIKKASTINLVACGAILIIALILGYAQVMSSYVVGIFWLSCIGIIMATSLNLCNGFLGQMALGHAGFMLIGAYTSALLSLAMVRADVIAGDGIEQFIRINRCGKLQNGCFHSPANMAATDISSSIRVHRK